MKEVILNWIKERKAAIKKERIHTPTVSPEYQAGLVDGVELAIFELERMVNPELPKKTL